MTLDDNTKETDPKGDRDALQVKVDQIRALFAREEKSVALTRYAIGAHVNEVTVGPETYGEKAVRTIANAVERDEDSLYDYAAVAGAWQEGAFKKLLAHRNAKGAPLSFSHFVELTKRLGKGREGLTPDTREHLLERALEENWTVRATGDAVRAALGASNNRPARPSTKLDQIRSVSAAWVDRAEKLEASVKELEERGVESSEHDAVTMTAEQLESMRDTCSKMAGRLRRLVADKLTATPTEQTREDDAAS